MIPSGRFLVSNLLAAHKAAVCLLGGPVGGAARLPAREDRAFNRTTRGRSR